MAKLTKKDAVRTLYKAVDGYEEKLSKRVFRLIYESGQDKHIEVTDVNFFPENFQHLTGIGGMKPKDFYAACIDRRLFENAISIDSFGNAQRKMALTYSHG